MPPITYAYQWQVCNRDGYDCSDIPAAISNSYTPTALDVGRTLAVVVTATNEVDSVAGDPVGSARVLPAPWLRTPSACPSPCTCGKRKACEAKAQAKYGPRGKRKGERK